MNSINHADVIAAGRVGLVDAALVRYLNAIKDRKRALYLQINGSIFNTIILRSHIEEFVAHLSCANGVIKCTKPFEEHNYNNKDYIHFPEKFFLEYSIDRICKKKGVVYSQTTLNCEKIIAFDDLNYIFDEHLCQRDRTIGLVSGSFDLIHLGHVRHIDEAKKMSDVVIVATMSTSSIERQEKNILKDRPIYSQEDRLTVLAALKEVDHIVVFEELNCIEVIKALRPNYFFKNDKDMDRKVVLDECELVKSLGGDVIVTKDNIGYSSTDIIDHIRRLHCSDSIL